MQVCFHQEQQPACRCHRRCGRCSPGGANSIDSPKRTNSSNNPNSVDNRNTSTNNTNNSTTTTTTTKMRVRMMMIIIVTIINRNNSMLAGKRRGFEEWALKIWAACLGRCFEAYLSRVLPTSYRRTRNSKRTYPTH